MHCLKMHFAHQAQLNAHVRPLETKMVVGRDQTMNTWLGLFIFTDVPRMTTKNWYTVN
jgi:hypothetical protein